jgi:raffinose/stachyose/melibiose transport system substrate-binding protein
MKKSLVAICLVSTMLFTASCGTGSPSSTNSGSAIPDTSVTPATSAASPSGEAKTITLWTNNKSKAVVEAMDTAAKNFEAKTKVKVNITYIENDPYKTKLKTVMASGQAPDIFHSWGGGWLQQFVDAGQVVDLTSQVSDFKSQLPESAWNLDTYSDKIYGVPYSLAGTAMFYNKAMFQKYGLTPPKTWSEMENVVKVLKSHNIIPFALGNASKWPGDLMFVYEQLRLGSGQVYMNAIARNGKNTFEDPSYIKAGQMIQQEVDDGWFPKGVNGINYDTGGSRMLFYTEKAGMMVMTTGLIANCRDENKSFYDTKLGITTFPTIEGGAGKADEVLCGNNAYSISKNCKNPEDALAFLKYLVTDPDINNKMANEGGLLVALKTAQLSDPMLKQAIDIQTNSSYMQNFYDQGMPTELGNLAMDTTQALFGKTITPEEAAKQMETKAKEILK